MQKIKFLIIILIIVTFALFIGFEIRDFGNCDFNKAFYFTLIYGLCYVVVITVVYIGSKTAFIRNHKRAKTDFANPLDIWLLAIPMCVLMIIAYLLLQWYVAEVFFCTMMSLSGMLFANNLGRGAGRWHIKKSAPFFIGCLLTIAYGIIIGGMK